MDYFFETSVRRMRVVEDKFVRSLMNEIEWDARLVGIKGSRGVGKTTLLLQRMKRISEKCNTRELLYLSLDNIRFTEKKILDVVHTFFIQGGRYLFLDEVHRYPDWSVNIKNIYDDYPEMKIVFTGSSLLEILNAGADLSRRAVVYTLQGLSFREYLNMTQETDFKENSLPSILANHIEIGGKGKNEKQLDATEFSFLAVDNVEIGFGKRVPLWLFGFLY